ncbi:hypothetical protein T310_0234 [Rasamsonia emersonii CBS 393.64]|uniref:Uncharacterized protein n=1 Tax=Rasamsonia emersonii (strain ATCC 16479 / CBS 393.64 / IMI 116815) TaxID=1408163 RepID=A0A0F4Z6P1_RASE3|nr:hypothetical protein T310_0234 [Rasamsonia emersonii CBS 393.64]KKA25756.1 hypothetical protein T310_0234 [Rasamsonia emersonii CBS 393.64]
MRIFVILCNIFPLLQSHSHQPHARFGNPRAYQTQGARYHGTAHEHLHVQISAVLDLDQGPCDRVPCQGGDTEDAQHHSHAHAGLFQVCGERAQRAGEESLDSGREGAVYHGEGVQSPDTDDSGPTIGENRTRQAEQDKYIQRTCPPVCDETGDPTTRGANSDGAGEAADVEETDVEAPEDEEHPDGEERIGRFLERCELDKRASLPRWQSLLKKQKTGEQSRQGDETEGPHRPGISYPGQKAHDNGREHHASCCRTGRCQPHGEGASFGEVGWQQRQGGTKHQTASDALDDALCEEELPVLLAEGGHEDAKDLDDGAHRPGELEEASVGGPTGEGADEEQQEDLDATDPGDVGGGMAQSLGVVRLEDAEAVDIAPGVADDQMGQCHLRPSLETAVGGWSGVSSRLSRADKRDGPGQDRVGLAGGGGMSIQGAIATTVVVVAIVVAVAAGSDPRLLILGVERRGIFLPLLDLIFSHAGRTGLFAFVFVFHVWRLKMSNYVCFKPYG